MGEYYLWTITTPVPIFPCTWQKGKHTGLRNSEAKQESPPSKSNAPNSEKKRIRKQQKGADHLFRVIRGSTTVNGCGRAEGIMLPPYVLYAAKNLRTKGTENGTGHAKYNVSDKGWMDTARFHDRFKTQSIPFLPPGRPVILIFDGHASHLNIVTIKEAIKNEVIILKLPSNSTHVLQPLGVGVYGPAKTAWETILIKFVRQNLGTPLNKELFPRLLAQL